MSYLYIIGFISLGISIYICRPLFKGAFRGFNDTSSTLEESIDKTYPHSERNYHTRFHTTVYKEGVFALFAMALGPLIPMLVLASIIFFVLWALIKLIGSGLGI